MGSLSHVLTAMKNSFFLFLGDLNTSTSLADTIAKAVRLLFQWAELRGRWYQGWAAELGPSSQSLFCRCLCKFYPSLFKLKDAVT